MIHFLFALISSQVWVTDSLTKVMPTDTPGTALNANLSLARCEEQSFQIAVRTDANSPLLNLGLQPSSLVNNAGLTLRNNITWAEVGVLKSSKGNFPEVLLPVTSVNIPINTTVSLLVTVKAPCDAAAGMFKGSIAFSQATLPAVRLYVEIYDFSITEASTKGALHFNGNWTLADFNPSSQRRWYGDLMLAYRMSPDNIWRNGPPDPDMLQHWYERGLTTYNVSKVDSGVDTKIIDTFFVNLSKEPDGAAIRSLGYFYGYDEKSRSVLDASARTNLLNFRQKYPDIPVHTTAHVYMAPWSDPLGDLNYYFFSSIVAEHTFYNYTDGELVRNTIDTSLNPRRPHRYMMYYGFRAEDPLLLARVCTWVQFQQKSDGILYNSVNAWATSSSVPAIDPSAGPAFPYTFSSGYTADDVIFRGTTGPLASMRMVQIRDGMQDYEYLRALAQKSESVETARELAETIVIGTPSIQQLKTTRATIAGYLAQPFLARHPDPEHRSVGNPFALTWRSEPTVTAFNVYFGDSKSAVASATTASPEYKGQIKSAWFKPQAYLAGHTYYWRVDEIVNGQIYKGYVWSFAMRP